MPNRAESYRGAPNVIISIAQKARPNVAGHSDDLRVQLTSFSTLVSRTPLGRCSSSPIPVTSIPVEPAAAPHVDVGEADGHDEQHDLDQPEDAQRVFFWVEGIEEDHLDV